jgi:O-methyltransferase
MNVGVAPVARFLRAPDSMFGGLLLKARMHLSLAGWRPNIDAERSLKQTIARLAPRYTMMSLPRLRSLASLVDMLHDSRTEGCVVECGTWRGGSLALMNWKFCTLGDERELWAFDSFQGLPPPSENDPSNSHDVYYPGVCAAPQEDVLKAMRAVGQHPRKLHVVPGWLADTLPSADTGPIAMLNVDVDWYESVRIVLESLFDRVVAGGIINFDDYGCWTGCDRAVHEFLEARGLPKSVLRRTKDRSGAWLRKE